MHVDITPGDRASDCGSPMRPGRIEYRSGKGLVIIHGCTGCGTVRANRIACDAHQGDDTDAIAEIMAGLQP
jgi:hypothetical protein